MKLEQRIFGRRGAETRMLCLIAETKEESRMIDTCLGSRVVTADGMIAQLQGEVRLSDGYGSHYILLEKKE